MEQETLRTRLIHLQQKSRKAVRLYSSVGRAEQREYAELQVAEWREANAELHRELVQVLDERTHRGVVGKLFAVRDRFYSDWRKAEATIHGQQAELIESAERADFIRAAQLARSLVSFKAREQAAQAAHAELQELITKSRLTQPAIELSPEATVSPDGAKDTSPSRQVSQAQEELGATVRRASGDRHGSMGGQRVPVQLNLSETEIGGRAGASIPVLAKVIPLRK